MYSYLQHVNVRYALATYIIMKTVLQLQLINTNLDKVPDQIENLTDLSRLYVIPLDLLEDPVPYLQ